MYLPKIVLVKEATPPSREPHYGDNEAYGWAAEDCARNLMNRLADWTAPSLDFKGSAAGRAWRVENERTRARIAFTSDLGDGHVDLAIHGSLWVCIEVYISGDLKWRGWAEETWEEKEIYPDGSHGKPNAEGDAPGRIGKRGNWLLIRCADFPGVPANEFGYFNLEEEYSD